MGFRGWVSEGGTEGMALSEENRAELPDRRTAVHHRSGHRTWIGARGTRGSPAGAEPHTQWLAGSIELDDHGFIVTGPDPSGQARRGDDWQQLLCGARGQREVMGLVVRGLSNAEGSQGAVPQRACRQD